MNASREVRVERIARAFVDEHAGLVSLEHALLAAEHAMELLEDQHVCGDCQTRFQPGPRWCPACGSADIYRDGEG